MDWVRILAYSTTLLGAAGTALVDRLARDQPPEYVLSVATDGGSLPETIEQEYFGHVRTLTLQAIDTTGCHTFGTYLPMPRRDVPAAAAWSHAVFTNSTLDARVERCTREASNPSSH